MIKLRVIFDTSWVTWQLYSTQFYLIFLRSIFCIFSGVPQGNLASRRNTSEKHFDAIQNLIIVADVVMDLVQVHET